MVQDLRLQRRGRAGCGRCIRGVRTGSRGYHRRTLSRLARECCNGDLEDRFDLVAAGWPRVSSRTFDAVVVGGGIVGLAVADALLAARPGSSVVVLDKEPALARTRPAATPASCTPASTTAPDSLKARLTRRGNELLHAFCDEHGVPVRRCGKLVVARRDRRAGRAGRAATRAPRQRRTGRAGRRDAGPRARAPGAHRRVGRCGRRPRPARLPTPC